MARDGGRGTRRRPRAAEELQQQLRQTGAELREQVRATRTQLDEANARITARSGRNLVFAIGVGLLLGGAFLASVLLAKQLFLVIVAVLVGACCYELAGALRQAGRHVPRFGSVVAGVLAQPVAYLAASPSLAASAFPGGWLLAIAGAVAFVVVWRLVQHVQRPVPGRELLLDLRAVVFVQLYVTLLGSCATVLTAQPGGQWWTLAFVSVVVATDVFAYVSGLSFGRHPMAPRISPKKTWEGFAGSAVAAVVLATVLAPLLLAQPLWFGPLFGAVILVTGTVGDLAESMLKRDIGVKDISSWLPGHGGFLDRVDSVLPSGAAALLLHLVTR